jgi:hypothetical protein
MALGVSTVGVVLIGWAVLLGLLLGVLWLRGGRAPSVEILRRADFTERRHGDDRRRVDIGPPPGIGERRSGFDRRKRGLTAAG